MLLLLVILGLLALLMFTKKEKFVELFGFSGYTKPHLDFEIDYASGQVGEGWVLQTAAVTPDMISAAVVPTQDLVKRESGICGRVIETNRYQRFTNEKGQERVKARFMLTTTNVGFPFGFGIEIDMVDGKIVKAQTQPMDAKVSYTPYRKSIAGEFTSYNEILKK